MAGPAFGANSRDALRKVLLELLAGRTPALVMTLDGEAWREIQRLAALHRLEPLLHYCAAGNEAVPAEIRDAWRKSFSFSAFTALQLAGELATTTAILQQAGHAPIALKGAWLAWHAYPHPALRPMRDIDLWLPDGDAAAAHSLLVSRGYAPEGAAQQSFEQSFALDKHLPPLRSPRGVRIELHHRLWEVDGRMDHAAPAATETAIRRRAVRIGNIAYLDPQDTLAHLIIHAVYDHRLDCGPLLLSDVSFLLQRTVIDWDRFWHDAEDDGWERGAALVLQMVREHAPDAAAPPTPKNFALPDGIGTALLLQELDTRQSAGVVATLKAGGLRAFLLRICARRHANGGTPITRDLNSEGGFVAWARNRLVRTVQDLARQDVRRQASTLATLSRWLDG